MSFATAPRMTFGTAIGTGFRKYADFTGRAGVAEFWWFILFVALVNAGTSLLDSMIPGSTASRDSMIMIGFGSTNGPLSGLWALGTVVPLLAIAVRRLRDGGNRWTQLFWLLLPIVGLIFAVLRFCDPSREPAPVQDAPVV